MGIARGLPVDLGWGWRGFCRGERLTLLVLGMPDEKLKRVTGRQTRVHNPPHRVLAYCVAPEAETLIGDIFDKTLRPAKVRTELTTGNRCNETGLQGRDPKSTGKADYNASRMSRWNDIKRCRKAAA